MFAWWSLAAYMNVTGHNQQLANTLRTCVFSYTQLPRWEGRRGNGKAHKSAKNSIVEQSFDRCAVASLCTIQLREKGGKFGGRIVNYHEIKKDDWNSLLNR